MDKWENVIGSPYSDKLSPEAHNLINILNNMITQIKTTPNMIPIYEFEISVMLDTMKQDDRFKEFNQVDPRFQG